MEAVHLVPDQCANFASHFSSVKIFQIDVFNFASHFIRVQIFQIYFFLKNEKFLFPPSHYNFCIVHCIASIKQEDRTQDTKLIIVLYILCINLLLKSVFERQNVFGNIKMCAYTHNS